LIQILRVRNLALIEELELELGRGLNVITGETGAGKTILLDAVALLSGRRVSTTEIRTGEAEARVEAILDAPALLERARELGLAGPDDEELLIVRTIAREGRGKVHVNGRLATVSVLAELMADVIEVASQGEHQRLLRPELQGELLDAHGGLADQVAAVESAFEDWRALASELEQRRSRAEERARREDQLRAEVEQIERAEVRAGESESLELERTRLAHIDRLGRGAAEALEVIDGEGGLRTQLGRARSALRDPLRIDASLAPVEDGLARAEVEITESLRELEGYAAALESDPVRLEQIEERLAALRRLRDRYGASEVAILEYLESAREELERIGGGEARSAALEAALEASAQTLREAAGVLGAARRAAAADLEQAVAGELRGLDMQKARFTVELEPAVARTRDGLEAPAGPRGAERAVFLLAANPGEEARRLREAASGGELARLLLALRNALRNADHDRVLLFDEVDAGVGGRTARRVGERLRAIGRDHDILCITHLPQVAALGTTHYRVAKHVRAGRTLTRVERLEGEERVEEIARMAGGGRVTDAARAHARELLSS